MQKETPQAPAPAAGPPPGTEATPATPEAPQAKPLSAADIEELAAREGGVTIQELAGKMGTSVETAATLANALSGLELNGDTVTKKKEAA